MPLPPSHHAFLQRATVDGGEERGFLDGRAGDLRIRPLHAPYVTRRRGVLEAIRAGVGWLLKNAARLIYLAPALVVVKLVLYFIDSPTSDLVIVAFVGLVILFFALLNLYIFISILWWLFGRVPTPYKLEVPFDDEGRAALPPAGGAADIRSGTESIGQLVRARGVIVRLGPSREGDATVLRDLWTEGEMRLTEAIDFAVVGRGQLPIVVRLGSAPLVVAKPFSIQMNAFASTAGAGTMGLVEQSSMDPWTALAEGLLVSLQEGNEVEVTGVVAGHIDNVDGFDLGGTFASVPLPQEQGDSAGSPFRDKPGGPGIILGEGPGAPISIRLLS
jgi:hypothetical protein